MADKTVVLQRHWHPDERLLQCLLDAALSRVNDILSRYAAARAGQDDAAIILSPMIQPSYAGRARMDGWDYHRLGGTRTIETIVGIVCHRVCFSDMYVSVTAESTRQAHTFADMLHSQLIKVCLADASRRYMISSTDDRVKVVSMDASGYIHSNVVLIDMCHHLGVPM